MKKVFNFSNPPHLAKLFCSFFPYSFVALLFCFISFSSGAAILTCNNPGGTYTIQAGTYDGIKVTRGTVAKINGVTVKIRQGGKIEVVSGAYLEITNNAVVTSESDNETKDWLGIEVKSDFNTSINHDLYQNSQSIISNYNSFTFGVIILNKANIRYSVNGVVLGEISNGSPSNSLGGGYLDAYQSNFKNNWESSVYITAFKNGTSNGANNASKSLYNFSYCSFLFDKKPSKAYKRYRHVYAGWFIPATNSTINHYTWFDHCNVETTVDANGIPIVGSTVVEGLNCYCPTYAFYCTFKNVYRGVSIVPITGAEGGPNSIANCTFTMSVLNARGATFGGDYGKVNISDNVFYVGQKHASFAYVWMTGIAVFGECNANIKKNTLNLISNPYQRANENGVYLWETGNANSNSWIAVDRNNFNDVRQGVHVEKENRTTLLTCNTFTAIDSYNVIIDTSGALKSPHGSKTFSPHNLFSQLYKGPFHQIVNEGKVINLNYYYDPALKTTDPQKSNQKIGPWPKLVKPISANQGLNSPCSTEHLPIVRPDVDLKTQVSDMTDQYNTLASNNSNGENDDDIAFTLQSVRYLSLLYVDSLLAQGKSDSAIIWLNNDSSIWAKKFIARVYLASRQWSSASTALTNLDNSYGWDADIHDFCQVHLALMNFYQYGMSLAALDSAKTNLQAITSGLTTGSAYARTMLNLLGYNQYTNDTTINPEPYPLPFTNACIDYQGGFGDDQQDSDSVTVTLAIVPNPTSGNFAASLANLTQNTETYTVKLLNYLGYVVAQQNTTISADNTATLNFDISNEPSGYYYLIVFRSGYVEARETVIKQ